MAIVKKAETEGAGQILAGDGFPATVKYADTLYTSRSLFLQDGRELKVQGGQVQVLADDAEALTYLAGNVDLQLLAE